MQSRGFWRIEKNAPGHAQMQHDRKIIRQPHKNIFPAAPEADDGLPGDRSTKSRRNLPSQIRAAENDIADFMALQSDLHTTHHGFDFREFRHECKAGYRVTP